MMAGSAASTASRPQAKPSTSLRWPHTVSKSTRLVMSRPWSNRNALPEPRETASPATSLRTAIEVLVVGSDLQLRRDAAPHEDLADLAQCEHGDAGLCQHIQVDAAWRLEGEVAAVPGADERSRQSREGSRDDPRHGVPACQQAPGSLAPLVETVEGHDIHVRGDLEDAVGRGVDDGPPGGHVLGPQFVDDRRSRSGLVAEDRAADRCLERGDQIERKAVRDRSGRAVW